MANSNENISSDYQKYLDRKHAHLVTDPRIIEQVAKKATNSNILSDEKIVAGEVNEVHKITTNAGYDVIVRISRSKTPRFKAESWAINQARASGIPAPEILLLDDVDTKQGSLSFCVERMIKGVPLRDVIKQQGIDSDVVKVLVEDAGEILARIHSIRVNGFGNLNLQGQGEFSSWEEYMLEWSDKAEYLRKLATDKGVNPDLTDKAVSVLESNRRVFSNAESRLQHGDYGMDHIFVDDGKITGIIDFENCKGADATWDFSWWSFFGGKRPPISWLENGYKRSGSFPTDYEHKTSLGRIRLGLDMLWYYNNEKNEHGFNFAVDRLTRGLSNL